MSWGDACAQWQLTSDLLIFSISYKSLGSSTHCSVQFFIPISELSTQGIRAHDIYLLQTPSAHFLHIVGVAAKDLVILTS